AAKEIGFKTQATKKPISRLAFVHLPVLVWRDDGQHFILAKIDNEHRRFLIHDLATNQPLVLSEEDFNARYSGEIIQFASRASLMGQLAKFDFTWFIPAVVKYRKILVEVLFVSIILQIFALITPLFFQVVMDKVLVHQGFSTLNVVAVALCIVILFEIILSAIRTYVFSHTTS
ncbi:type I secretion system permease/ATPase, partial [[Haemophilus] felis]|nr:type I secretion system permease/ATPase [[Haemophilus] felis]